MRKKPTDYLITLFLTIIISLPILRQNLPGVSANAAELPAIPAQTARQDPLLTVTDETDQGMIIEFSIPEMTFTSAQTQGQSCQSVSFPGMENTLTEQNLFLPVQGVMIGIPPDADPSLRIITAEFQLLEENFVLCPLEKPNADLIFEDSLAKDSLPVDFWHYEPRDSFSPEHVVELVETGFMRSQRYAQIQFIPVQYQTARNELRVYSSIRVEILFNNTANEAHQAIEPIADPYFDTIFSEVLINADQARQWRVQQPIDFSRALPQSTMIVNSLKIQINQDGIYQITYEDFLASGVSPEILNQLDPRTFQLYNQATEIAINVQSQYETEFSPGDVLIFYGQKTNTKYTNTNAYWLIWGDAFGLRMNRQDAEPTNAASVPECHAKSLKIERDLRYYSSQPSGSDRDHWYWASLFSTSGNPLSAEFEFDLNLIDPQPHTATLHGVLKGYSASPNHRTRIYINSTDQLVTDLTFASGTEMNFSASFPSSYLVEGNNKIILEANPDGSRSLDFLLINRFELDYHSRYFSENDQIFFSESGHWEFTIDGFSTASVQAYNITDPRAPNILIGEVVDDTPNGHQIRFETHTSETNHYLVLNTLQYLRPLNITQATPANLRSADNAADYIIISHGDFLEQTRPLADLRASQGYRVQVVDVQDIYDVFNDGVFSPEAIKSFLSYAYTHWTPPAPSFILLVGDGHYDFKNNLGYGETIYIPPYMDLVDPIVGETATDNRYVSISGDDILPDMHIGRFPVRSSAEAQVLVEKTINYEIAPPEGEWTTSLTFVADNADSGGNFPAETDHIISLVPEGYSIERIFLGVTHTKTEATAAIKAAINSGSLLVHYAGHGSVVQWAGEGLLKLSDLPALTNHGKLPFMLPMTCSEGYFIHHNPPGMNYSSLGESIVRMAGGGAVGSWSPTGFGMAAGHMIMEEHLIENLFNQNYNQVGFLTTQAKYHLFATTGAFRDLIETYVVFGDPALRLNTIPIPVEPPSNLLAAVVSTTQIDLSWSDNSSDESGFRIERSYPNMENWVEIGIVGDNVTTFSDTGLTPGTTYHYRVRAFRNTDGKYSDYSQPESAITHNLPNAPTKLVAKASSSTEINMSWTDNSDEEAGFEIERSHTGTGDWSVIGVVGANTIKFNDTGLIPDTSYFYRVRAYFSNQEGYSSYSNIAYDKTHCLIKYFFPLFKK